MGFKRLRKKMVEEGIDCGIFSGFSSDPNIKYFLGFEFKNCLLFVPKKGNSFLLAPEMEIPYLRTKTDIKIRSIKKNVSESLEEIAKGKNVFGINKRSMTVKEFEWLKKDFKQKKYKDISSIMESIRAVKNEDEIKKIRKSCSIAGKILQEVLENIRDYKSEDEVKRYLLRRTADFGCEIAFEPLVASGKNSSYIHYESCDERIKKGFFYIDFGVDYKGYKSDITRTIYLGVLPEKKKEIYNRLLDVQKEAIRMIKPGIKVCEIDKFVRKKLGDLNKNFTHALGHGIGINVHEQPIIRGANSEIIREGMVFTIEPGVYFPGKFGIRIEDTLVVTKKGSEILTKTDKELKVIE